MPKLQESLDISLLSSDWRALRIKSEKEHTTLDDSCSEILETHALGLILDGEVNENDS